MKITAITCTFERPQAFALCQRYMARQTRQPDQWLILDGPEPMRQKVLSAFTENKVEGDAVLFIEDDDYYFPTWIEWCERQLARGFDIVGQGYAVYYQVRRRWWSDCRNNRHASLCQTAIARTLYEPLCNLIPAYDNEFFDTRLWRIECNRYLNLPNDSERLVIGIKGMPGKQGYSHEHQDETPPGVHEDPSLLKLWQLIGKDALNYATFGHQRFNPSAPSEGATGVAARGEANQMKVEVHLLTWNEERIIPYTIRHYQTFATRIVIHDSGSTDKTRAIADEMGAEVEEWDTGNEFNDRLNTDLKNRCWIGTNADWVICADADELLYFPYGALSALATYEKLGAVMIKPRGYEMFTEHFPATTGQIYDEVKAGAPDDKWYAKPILFSAKRLRSPGFGVGAHEADPVLIDGRKFHVGEHWPFSVPPAFLLHFHQIGPMKNIAAVYDERRKRLCDQNVKNRWGNFKPGIEHAKEKRDYILARLQEVIG